VEQPHLRIKIFNMRHFFVLFLMASLASCNIGVESNVRYGTVTLTDETLPKVMPLNLVKLDISEDYVMGHTSCFVYKDSILLVLKDGDPYPLTHLLTVVNINNGNIIGEYFTRGQGPGEILSALGRLSNNYLDIRCYTMNRLIPFNIDSAIIYGNSYCPNIIDAQKARFSEWASISDTSFLIANSYYFAGSKECKENSLLPEFYKVNIDGSFYPKYDLSDYKKIKHLTSDVSRWTISINKKKSRIVCCYMYQPYIQIFDEELNVIKKIGGPEPDDGKYVARENYMYFEDGMNHYYETAFCDDENIFVINRRNRKCKDVENYVEIEKEKTEIFRLDWEGNVIGRYSAKGKDVIRVGYSKNSNTLYLWVYEDERSMYKAKLD